MGRRIKGKGRKTITIDNFQKEFRSTLDEIKSNEKKLIDLNNQIDRLRSFKKGSTFRSLGGLTPLLRETQEELKDKKKERTKVKAKIKRLEIKKEKLLQLEVK